MKIAHRSVFVLVLVFSLGLLSMAAYGEETDILVPTEEEIVENVDNDIEMEEALSVNEIVADSDTETEILEDITEDITADIPEEESVDTCTDDSMKEDIAAEEVIIQQNPEDAEVFSENNNQVTEESTTEQNIESDNTETTNTEIPVQTDTDTDTAPDNQDSEQITETVKMDLLMRMGSGNGMLIMFFKIPCPEL